MRRSLKALSYKLQVVLSDDFYTKIKAQAEIKNLPVASLVRSIVAEWLEKKNKDKEENQD